MCDVSGASKNWPNWMIGVLKNQSRLRTKLAPGQTTISDFSLQLQEKRGELRFLIVITSAKLKISSIKKIRKLYIYYPNSAVLAKVGKIGKRGPGQVEPLP